MRRASVVILAVLALAVVGSALPVVGSGFSRTGQGSLEAAFAPFWRAATPQEAAAAAAAIVRAGPSFDEALARLRRGRPYDGNVPRGVVAQSHTISGREFRYALDVPADYDPARRYQVRIQLHGGVSRPDAREVAGSIGSLAGAAQIYVLPIAWAAAPWWDGVQVENLRAIVDRLKRTYNVDENRVVVSGVSDGGTGAYYVAMRDTTPYASFLPLNGFIMILANASLGIREQLFLNNLKNKPFFVVNGGRDQLYPTSLVDPYIEHLQQGGVTLEYLPQPEAGHNTAWWPQVRDRFEQFVRDHPRDPHPARLTWEAEQPGRAHWLRIDRLRPRGAEEPLADLNERAAGASPNFGVQAAGMRITSVASGSNAEQFGLLPGDLVERINGRAIPAAVPLLDLLETYDAGTRVAFTVTRDAASIELAGTFEPRMTARVVPLFPRRGSSGRVDLVREGNTIRATTRGVAGFTLLLSPDVIDFSRPVVVVVDGRTAFDSVVRADVDTLLRWAAADNDRTMLYGVELPVSVP